MLYTRLPHDRCTRVLRLLKIYPEETAKLRIEICTLDLDTDSLPLKNAEEDSAPSFIARLTSDSPADYDALSYTWGAPSSAVDVKAQYTSEFDVDIEIIIDGSQKQYTRIGRNLYEALVHIWSTGKRRYLWVDKLCINQDDPDEKSTHVLMMTQIYSRAAGVIVWLGVDDTNPPIFRDVSTILWTAQHKILPYLAITRDPASVKMVPVIDWTAKTPEGRYQNINVILTGVKIKMEPNFVQSLDRFFAQRCYFSRAWVVQEVALARRAVVILGEKYFDYLHLDCLARLYIAMREAYILVHWEFHEDQESCGFGQELVQLSTLSRRRDAWAQEECLDRQILIQQHGSTDSGSHYLACLLDLFGGGSLRRTTDPRDAIYSLLGYVSSLLGSHKRESPVVPDYTASVEDVFTAFTAKLLRSLPYLSVLSLVCQRQYAPGASTAGSYIGRLPSWVPDFAPCQKAIPNIWFWALSNQIRELGKMNIPKFCAGLDESQHSNLRCEDNSLSLFARRCSVIKHTIRPFTSGYKSHLERLQNTLEGLTSSLRLCLDLNGTLSSGLTATETLFHIICPRSPTLGNTASQDFRTLVVNGLMDVLFEVIHYKESVNTADVNERLQPAWTQAWEVFSALAGQSCIPTPEDLARLENLKAPFKYSQGGIISEDAELVKMINGDRNTLNVDEFTTLFVTEDRYMGRVQNEVRKGDELWLICQAKVPFVVRPTAEGKYILLGEALVPGAMYGELMKNGVAGEPEWITFV